MRVLMVTHAYPPTIGGVESHVADIASQLAQRGHEVCCLVGGEPRPTDTRGAVNVIRNPDLSVQSLLQARTGFDFAALNQQLLAHLTSIVSECLRTFQPTVLHAHNAHHFAPELAQALLAQQPRIPALNSVHDRVGEHVFESVLNYPWDHILYASEYLRRSLPTSRPHSVRWLGIDLARFSANVTSHVKFEQLGRPVIFHPARLLRWKGIDVGLRAFLEMRKEFAGASLVLCGSESVVEPQKEIDEFRRELVGRAALEGAETSVHFLSFSRAEMPSALRSADLVWYPTTDEEPLGLVPLECMASGVPVIVSRSGGMAETVSHGETGLIVPKHDATALARAAVMLLRNEQLRHRLTSLALAWVKQCDLHSYVREVELIYQEVSWKSRPQTA